MQHFESCFWRNQYAGFGGLVSYQKQVTTSRLANSGWLAWWHTCAGVLVVSLLLSLVTGLQGA